MYANEVETKKKEKLPELKNKQEHIPMWGFWLKPPPLQNFQFNLKISLNMSAGLQDLIPWEFNSNNPAWSEYGYMFWNHTFWCSLRRQPSLLSPPC